MVVPVDHVACERVHVIDVDERDGAAGESASGHARSEASSGVECDVDDRVETGPGDLVLVAQAHVAL